MAHHFVIEPLGGVGPIRLGMHKDEVSHAFTYVYRSFFKGSKVRSDHCEVVGLIIHYDDASVVDHIEVVSPVHGTVTLELFGVDIAGFTIQQVADLLRRQASDVTRGYYGYECPSLGLSTFNSDARDESVRVECLGVGLRRDPTRRASTATKPGSLVIRRPSSPQGIPLDEWLAHVAKSDVLQLSLPRMGINPFTDQPTELNPAPGSAFFETPEGRCSITYQSGTLKVRNAGKGAVAVLEAVATALDATLDGSPRGA